MNDLEHTIKAHILDEFLPGEDPSELNVDTELVSTGILDSLATLKLVAYLEEQFKISIGAHETDAENLETVARIARLVASKTGARGGA